MTVAAIGSDGTRPVVWGLGASAVEARAEASSEDPAWDSAGGVTCEITPAMEAKIRSGVVAAADLGIWVGVRNGEIVGAEVQS